MNDTGIIYEVGKVRASACMPFIAAAPSVVIKK